MTVAVQGVSIIRERVGICANVLDHEQRCDVCEYCAPTNSFAVKMLPYGAYDTQSFTCPSCATVRP